jgi:hypothetical protein
MRDGPRLVPGGNHFTPRKNAFIPIRELSFPSKEISSDIISPRSAVAVRNSTPPPHDTRFQNTRGRPVLTSLEESRLARMRVNVWDSELVWGGHVILSTPHRLPVPRFHTSAHPATSNVHPRSSGTLVDRETTRFYHRCNQHHRAIDPLQNHPTPVCDFPPGII